jgi:hypothetical protein
MPFFNLTQLHLQWAASVKEKSPSAATEESACPTVAQSEGHKEKAMEEKASN